MYFLTVSTSRLNWAAICSALMPIWARLRTAVCLKESISVFMASFSASTAFF